MVEVTSFKLWLSQFIILLGLLAFFIWLGIRPKSPRYTITDFSIQNATIAVGLEVENPNKDSDTYFGNITLNFYNNQDFIASANVSGFSLDGEETTNQPGVAYVDGNVWKALEGQISNGKIQLRVVLVTKVRYKTWGIKSPRNKVNKKAQLPIGSDGKVPGKTKMHNTSKRWRIRLT